MPVNSFENYPMSWKPRREELEQPYYLSIAAGLEKAIRSGQLIENTKLPPQRELADFLDLNVGTVTRAYKLCEWKGLLYAVTGKGTFVSPGVLARNTFLEENHGVMEMGTIQPFYECNQEIMRAAQGVLGDLGQAELLEYSDPFGSKGQIGAAAKWLRHFGIDTTGKNLLLTAGAQNALAVVLVSLFRAGDKIAVDAFTYTNFKGLANFLDIRLIPVDVDAYGMTPDSLLRICKNMDIKGIYLMPTCSNPTSLYMPPARRQELAKLAHRYGLLVIEDDIYSFLAPKNVQSFFSLLPGQTVHICSISKSLCAGLRVAFLAFPEAYREALTAGMLHINLKTVSLNAEIVAHLIETGTAMQIVRQKTALAKRRNRIFGSVFPGQQQDLAARFFYWLPLPGQMTSQEAEVLSLQRGVHILGSHRFAIGSGSAASFIRVAVTSTKTEKELEQGLQILKGVLEGNAVSITV